ncbi:MAG: DUF11 domain-containing protein, partial [Firmicutes bacterium]|nr:DUF11 domain-containing protein [Bacillota bacterium]
DYTVTTVDGTLKITPATLTVVTGGGLKEYDGTPLTKKVVEVGGDGFAEGEGATYDVTGSQTLVGSSNNAFTYELNRGTDAGNYNITPSEGTLTVTDVNVDKDKVITKTLDNEPENKVTNRYKLGETIEWEVKVVNIYDEAKTITLTEQAGVVLDKSIFENVAPGETVTANASRVVSEADILAAASAGNKYSNKVTASFEGGITIDNDNDDAKLENPDPKLTITKKANPETGVKAGDTVTYTITVTNTGNVKITGIEVTDDMTGLVKGSDWPAAKFDLKAGDHKVLTATYTVTQADIESGADIENTAKATGTKPDGTPIEVKADEDVTPQAKFAELKVTKTVTNGKLVDGKYYAHEDGTPFKAGDTVEFDITVQNIGNYTLKNVVVKDVLNGAEFVEGTGYTIEQDGSAVIASLSNGAAPGYLGGSITLKAQYKVTAADEGKVMTNKATAETDDDIAEDGEDTEDFIVGIPLKITAKSGNKKYDGKALTGTEVGYTSEGLKAGDELTVVLVGTVTNVSEGTVGNDIQSYAVTRNGAVVTGEYTVTTENGTLEIRPTTLTVVTPNAEKTYDGEPLTAEGTIEGFVNNETATFATTGTQTLVGSSTNTYTLVFAPSADDMVNLLADNTAKKENYTVEEKLGTLTVTDVNVDEDDVITKTLSNDPKDTKAFKVG